MKWLAEMAQCEYGSNGWDPTNTNDQTLLGCDTAKSTAYAPPPLTFLDTRFMLSEGGDYVPATPITPTLSRSSSSNNNPSNSDCCRIVAVSAFKDVRRYPEWNCYYFGLIPFDWNFTRPWHDNESIRRLFHFHNQALCGRQRVLEHVEINRKLKHNNCILLVRARAASDLLSVGIMLSLALTPDRLPQVILGGND